jgi:hypothetical protein
MFRAGFAFANGFHISASSWKGPDIVSEKQAWRTTQIAWLKLWQKFNRELMGEDQPTILVFDTEWQRKAPNDAWYNHWFGPESPHLRHYEERIAEAKRKGKLYADMMELRSPHGVPEPNDPPGLLEAYFRHFLYHKDRTHELLSTHVPNFEKSFQLELRVDSGRHIEDGYWRVETMRVWFEDPGFWKPCYVL